MLGAGVTDFDGGDILLGGDGSDIITGRGGNDIIDGDKWLEWQIGVFAVVDVDAHRRANCPHKSMTTLPATCSPD